MDPSSRAEGRAEIAIDAGLICAAYKCRTIRWAKLGGNRGLSAAHWNEGKDEFVCFATVSCTHFVLVRYFQAHAILSSIFVIDGATRTVGRGLDTSLHLTISFTADMTRLDTARKN